MSPALAHPAQLAALWLGIVFLRDEISRLFVGLLLPLVIVIPVSVLGAAAVPPGTDP